MKKLWYDWKEMRRDVNSLCREIMLDKFDPDVIVGLSRGGLTPGVMMSHWMKKPFKPIKTALRDYPEWEDYLPRKTDKKVLVVDDVCDSGDSQTTDIWYGGVGKDTLCGSNGNNPLEGGTVKDPILHLMAVTPSSFAQVMAVRISRMRMC